jgi:hypothetical protein
MIAFCGEMMVSSRGVPYSARTGGDRMATDYDSPRRGVEVLDPDVDVSALGRVSAGRSGVSEVDAPDVVDAVDLPGADLSGEELVVVVEPMRADEFRCARCFLVQSRHLVSEARPDGEVCRDCAA